MIRFRVIYFTILLCISVLFPSVVLSQDKSSDLNGIWKTSDGGTLITITHKGSSLYAMYLIDKSSALTNSSLENSDDALNGKFNGSVFTGGIHLLYTVKYSQKCHKEWSAVNEFNYDSDNHLFLMDFTRPYIELTLSKDGNKLQGSYKRPFDENNCIIKSPVLENIAFERANISTKACAQPKVAFLQIEGSGLTPVGPEGVRYGAAFVVEADCGSPQDGKTRELTLNWGGDSLVLDMARQGDGRVYRSEKLYLMPPKGKRR